MKSSLGFSSFSVDNIDRAKEFYTNVLGLGLKSENMGLQLELPGGGELYIYDKPDHAPASFTVLNFVVDAIDNTMEELSSQHGVNFEHYEALPMPMQQDEKGVLRGKAAGEGPDIAWFTDPAGNVIALMEM